MTDAEPNAVDREPETTPQRERYILALRAWTRIALFLLAAACAVYLFGVLTPAVPLEKLSHYWSLPVGEFIDETGLPTGWQWTSRLYQGDVLTMIPAAFLAAMTGFCLLSILPIFVSRRNWVFVVIVLLQLAVFVVAALP